MSSSSRPPAATLPSERVEEDAFEAALADEALAGFEGVVPPVVLASMRARLMDAYAAHPTGRRLARQAKPDPTRARSGDVERHRDAAARPPEPRAKGKGSG